MNKYHSRKVTKDGITFDSIKECRRFAELTLLAKAGKITGLKRQVKYTLIPAQYELDAARKGGKGKCLERECAYIADFVYQVPQTSDKSTEPPITIVEDTKGFKTKDYIIKRKLMLSVHGIRIREI